MQALILVAGTGSRLNLGLPKCLVEVGGRPLLDHQLDAIEQAGADQVTLVLGYQHKLVEDAATGRAEVVLNERYGCTNSLYSFWLARHAVEGDVMETDWVAAPFNDVARPHRISCMDVAGQPWVEIDFPEDLELARSRTWLAIANLSRKCPLPDDLWAASVEPDEMREVAR
jgi:choline kinase